MSFDQLCVIGMGIGFTGIGFTMRKQQNKQWRVFVFWRGCDAAFRWLVADFRLVVIDVDFIEL